MPASDMQEGRLFSMQGNHEQPPEPDLHPELLRGKYVVIGIGNPYMKDDAIGLRVTRELRSRELGKDVLVYDYHAMDLSLLSFFRNASKIIIVDALKSGSSPGTVSKYLVSQKDGPLLKLPNLHELQLFDIMDLANHDGLLPSSSIVIGVEPSDCGAGEGLTEKVAAAVPVAVSRIIAELN
jgi:hydrogenase maturation protease